MDFLLQTAIREFENTELPHLCAGLGRPVLSAPCLFSPGRPHTCSLHMTSLWLSWSCNGRVGYLQLKLCGLQNPKYLLSGPRDQCPCLEVISSCKGYQTLLPGPGGLVLPVTWQMLWPMQTTPGGVTAQLLGMQKLDTLLPWTDAHAVLSTSAAVRGGRLETWCIDQGPSRKQMATQIRLIQRVFNKEAIYKGKGEVSERHKG